MKMVKLSRYYLWILPVALLALAGLVWNRPKPVSADRHGFDLDDVHGRYISVENGFDVSTDHPLSATACPLGCAGGPVFFATTEVMQADGKGNVCGSADGFYGGQPPPGVNLGPAYYHGTYTVEPDGRITIKICPDSPSATAICTAEYETTACTDPTILTSPESTTSVSVGYIQDHDGDRIDTVDQVEHGTSDSSGFLVHTHAFTRGPQESR